MYAAEHARAHPERPALVMAASGQTLTYAEYEAACNALAQLFRDTGLRRGDHIAVFLENHPLLVVACGAAERTGLYYTLVNSSSTAEEVAYLVDDSTAQLVITSAAKAAVAAGLPRVCPRVRRWLMTDTDRPPPGYQRYSEAVAGFSGEPVPDEELGTAMLYSSGTTGRPKGVLRPLPAAHPGEALPVVEFVTWLFGFRAGQTYLSPAPLYHSAPQASVAATLRGGGTVVVMERFDPAHYLELLGRHRVTHSQLVPTMFVRLLKLPEEVRRDADVSSLEQVVHAAAPCPVPVKRAMLDWWGPIIREYYGATEANGFTLATAEDWLAHPGTVGRAVLGEAVILADDGTPCPVGTPGTIWFRGATNFSYWQDERKTADCMDEGGQLSTVGDVGYLDADGFLYLTDRKSYMIISGGVNVYPQETENLLVTHPKVYDAAVFGIPNAEMGEEVKAVVQPVEGSAADAELASELQAFCRAHLAPVKCPRSIDFVEELPRSATGKLYKRLLRDPYWEGHASVIS